MPAADTPPEDEEPADDAAWFYGGGDPAFPEAGASMTGGDADDEDCGVPEPIAPHAARGPERLPRDFSGKAPAVPAAGLRVLPPHPAAAAHI